MLETTVPGLALRRLATTDAGEHFRLVQDNSEHLTALGDYLDQVSMTLEETEEELSGEHLRFGIMLEGKLIGRVDLNPVDPPNYGIGYWLAENATGRGYATAAIRALLEFARSRLAASDIYAGVTHGNGKSTAVLERLGFQPVATFARYTRFHLHLG